MQANAIATSMKPCIELPENFVDGCFRIRGKSGSVPNTRCGGDHNIHCPPLPAGMFQDMFGSCFITVIYISLF